MDNRKKSSPKSPKKKSPKEDDLPEIDESREIPKPPKLKRHHAKDFADPQAVLNARHPTPPHKKHSKAEIVLEGKKGGKQSKRKRKGSRRRKTKRRKQE
jgi:hypothetical protein